MFRVLLPLTTLRDPQFTPQMKLNALEQAYCNAFACLDACDLPVAQDAALRKHLDVLIAIALGIDSTGLPEEIFDVVDLDHAREQGQPVVSAG